MYDPAAEAQEILMNHDTYERSKSSVRFQEDEINLNESPTCDLQRASSIERRNMYKARMKKAH